MALRAASTGTASHSPTVCRDGVLCESKHHTNQQGGCLWRQLIQQVTPIVVLSHFNVYASKMRVTPGKLGLRCSPFSFLLRILLVARPLAVVLDNPQREANGDREHLVSRSPSFTLLSWSGVGLFDLGSAAHLEDGRRSPDHVTLVVPLLSPSRFALCLGRSEGSRMLGTSQMPDREAMPGIWEVPDSSRRSSRVLPAGGTAQEQQGPAV